MDEASLAAGTDLLERYADPTRLALVGHHVRQRLATTPGVERIGVADAEMYLVPGFLTKRDCRQLIEAINRRAVPSTLYDGKEREGFRTSWTHHFERSDPLTVDIQSYLADLTGIDLAHAEPIQGQRYQVGQEYRAHHDFFHVGKGHWQHEAHRGGQRTWTAMAFLNEPREGGETDFPLLGVALRPKAGALAIWNNMDPAGMPNRKTLHAAIPVRRGIKHVITQWYRQGPWLALND